jgi:AhpD family alkylhydroperoxidase
MWKIACAALLLFRNPGRHHLGMPGRLRRNPQLKGKSVMRTLVASAGLALLLALATEPSVSAQEPPAWMKQTLPDQALKPLWDTYQAVLNPTGALDGKTKQLIALGVSAQIPCAYCVYATTKAAKAAGATDAQIKEAIATAALVRFNSTMLNGSDGGRDSGTVFTSK